MNGTRSDLAQEIAKSKNLIVGTWQWGGEFFRAKHKYPRGTCRTCGRVPADHENDLCNYDHGGVRSDCSVRKGILEEDDCRGIVLAALQNGVSCFDTAADYGKGRAESLLGKIGVGLRPKSDVFSANRNKLADADLARLIGGETMPTSITVSSKILLSGRTTEHQHSCKVDGGLLRRHAKIHEKLWANYSQKRGDGFFAMSVGADGLAHFMRRGKNIEYEFSEGESRENLSVMHADEMVIARQLLSSDHRLCGILSSVCLHSFEEAQMLAGRQCWWKWLRILRDEFEVFKYYGATAKTPKDCELAASWPILDYISVPFNALTHADYRSVLTSLKKKRPQTVILARETLSSGFLAAHYSSRKAWLRARLPCGCDKLPVEELQTVYTRFDEWRPVADSFKKCAEERGLPLGSAGALFALGSGLFDGVTLGFSSLAQARETLDRWEQDRKGATEFHALVVSRLEEAMPTRRKRVNRNQSSHR